MSNVICWNCDKVMDNCNGNLYKCVCSFTMSTDKKFTFYKTIEINNHSISFVNRENENSSVITSYLFDKIEINELITESNFKQYVQEVKDKLLFI